MEARGEEASASPAPLTPAEQAFIRKRLRARKEAIKRLALEDALGMEKKEQAKAESSVLSMVGGAPFLGVKEQKAKLTAYAADAADAMERAKRIKEAAEEASSEAASVAVLAVARAPEPGPFVEERRKRAAVLAATRPEDKATVKALLEDADRHDVAAEEAKEARVAEAARAERERLSEEAQAEAARAAKEGPAAVQLLAMRQMWEDLQRVRAASGEQSSEEAEHQSPETRGRRSVVGSGKGALADAMGWTGELQGR